MHMAPKQKKPVKGFSEQTAIGGKFGQFLRILCGCHAIPGRSFHFCGRPFPICARCTGELAGVLIGIPTMIVLGIPRFWVAVLMMLPLIVDGTVQRLTPYESTNIRRLATGILFGIALVFGFLYFHQACVLAAREILKLLGLDPFAVNQAMQRFLP